ncbi:hypothetical protein Rhe02_53550 [Rhizocola hellebori]|uniref:Uncharacterized protein n=1 Tax=Rhizocola hellebori TaxID=1392758 RepID=A0A8J3VIU4_9ACTN|nr:hypothetical protein [Rhizocola hellebori]GIH07288.1 hypothetical protein Rhe02_53550 [Rhizocola hellebori]
MADRRRSIGSAPLWMVGTLGAAITALGFYVQTNGNSATNQMVAGTLTAVGGGVIGAAISIYFAATEGRDTLAMIRKMMADFSKAGMRSEENSLSPIRRSWHYYYLTRKDDKYLWRHFVYRFQDSTTPNSIEVMIVDESAGEPYEAFTEVALRKDRLIMVEIPKNGDEPPLVVVAPGFTEGYRDVRAGVVILKTWDATGMLSKCLWSTRPLTDSNGREVSHEAALILEELWQRNFARDYEILPLVSDKPAAKPSSAGSSDDL